MARSSSFVIEVPNIQRTRTSSADQAKVSGMAAEAAEGVWVTDGETYETYGDAGNASQVYRRAIAKEKNAETYHVKSKVWGVNGDTIVTDRNAPAEWKFALTLDPSRQKRTRNRTS
jgi:hypothetical protein